MKTIKLTSEILVIIILIQTLISCSYSYNLEGSKIITVDNNTIDAKVQTHRTPYQTTINTKNNRTSHSDRVSEANSSSSSAVSELENTLQKDFEILSSTATEIENSTLTNTTEQTNTTVEGDDKTKINNSKHSTSLNADIDYKTKDGSDNKSSVKK